MNLIKPLTKKAIGPRHSIPELEKIANQNGIDLTIEEQGGYIYLIWIARMFGEKGSATEVITTICEYADKNHKIIRLEALSGKIGLVNYYKKFGFVINRNDMKKVENGWDETESAGPVMQRLPK